MANYQLDFVCDFINGGSWSDTEYAPSGIHVVKVTNLSEGRITRRDDNYLPLSKYEKYKQHELKTDDIIVSTVGSHPTQPGSVVGRVALVSSEYAGSFLNQNAACVRVNKLNLVTQRYLFYLANTVLFKHHIESRARGSANQVRMAIGELKKFKSEYPKISVQKKIAAVLSAYDDLIETNKRRIALLEKMVEEIYREWFIRLRFPGHEKVKVVKGVPIDWDHDRASAFFSVVKGKSYGGDEVTENPSHMPFITLKSFNRGGGYREDGLKYYSGRYNDDQIVLKNDIVMAVTDMTQNREVVGRVAKVPDFGDKGAVISLDVIKLVPKKTTEAFLYSFLRFAGFAECIKEFANGANVLHLKSDLVTQQKIHIPPMPLQQKFSEIVKPIYDQIDLLSVSIKRMTETRDMLLPRLISGKLSVENLDIQFPPGMGDM